MSDHDEDIEMDAGTTAATDTIMFGGEHSGGNKGKRSAANLPVEAEDSLPWYVEKIPDVSIHLGTSLRCALANRMVSAF